jgi:hypothetical protein
MDKWHISPFYGTLHVLAALLLLGSKANADVGHAIRSARSWLIDTQGGDGSWGWHGMPTAEETAYALLALAALDHSSPDEAVRTARRAGATYLRAWSAASAENVTYPALWLDKCLYTPPGLVATVIQSALSANLDVAKQPELVA